MSEALPSVIVGYSGNRPSSSNKRRVFTAPFAVRHLAQSNTLTQRSMRALPKRKSRPGTSSGVFGDRGRLARKWASRLVTEIPVDPPGTVCLGVGQSGVTRGFIHVEVDQLAFAGMESFFGFEETLHLSQLAKEHRDELIPAAKAARGALALARGDHSFKNGARDLPKNSTEMMDTLAVGGAPRLGRIVLAGTPFYGNRPPPQHWSNFGHIVMRISRRFRRILDKTRLRQP